MEGAQKTPEEEMEDHLKQQTLVVKQNGHAMKRALDQENRDDALKYAQQMLATLATAGLSQMYYDLYNSASTSCASSRTTSSTSGRRAPRSSTCTSSCSTRTRYCRGFTCW